jgi:hypothetical protein
LRIQGDKNVCRKLGIRNVEGLKEGALMKKSGDIGVSQNAGKNFGRGSESS